MPWKIEARDGEYCVIKYDGEVEKCHPTKAQANAHMRALYASEDKNMLGRVTGLVTDLLEKIKLLKNKPEEIKDSQEPSSSFSLFKAADGTWRWSAIWTNKYRDEDNPPEILAEAAHIDFAEAVGAGDWESPDLQFWHVPDSTWGKSTATAYDRDSGFTLSVGAINKGFEPVAEALASLPPEKRIGVSHGMPRAEIVRDPDDPTIIVRYRTSEISPLPLEAAANKLTNFVVLGGKDMNLAPDKEKEMRDFLGDKFDEVAALLNLKKKEAGDLGLDFKEQEKDEREADEVKDKEAEAETEIKAEVPETPEEKEETPITRKEIMDGLALLITPIAESVLALRTATESLQQQVKDLQKGDEEKIAEKTEWTPAASLSELIQNSVIGKDKVYVDGRKKEAKDGPKETQVESKDAIRTGRPFFDEVLSGIVSGNARKQENRYG